MKYCIKMQFFQHFCTFLAQIHRPKRSWRTHIHTPTRLNLIPGQFTSKLTCIDFNPSVHTKQLQLYKSHYSDGFNCETGASGGTRTHCQSMRSLSRLEDVLSKLIMDHATDWTESETLSPRSFYESSLLISGKTWSLDLHTVMCQEFESHSVLRHSKHPVEPEGQQLGDQVFRLFQEGFS